MHLNLLHRAVLQKALRLPGHKNAVQRKLCSRKRHLLYFFTPKRSGCVTLLVCGHLEDYESELCTVTYCTVKYS